MKLPRPVKGIIPPLATPLVDGETFDKEGMRRLIEHVLTARMGALFVLGSTGETPCFSYALRREILDASLEMIGGRAPVIVGISETSLVEAVDFAKKAADAGADAVVTVPPYYYRLSPAELQCYCQRLADRVPLPLFLYNIPQHTKTEFDVESVHSLASHPNIVGIKDSTGDVALLKRFKDAVAHRADFALLCGVEEVLGEAVLMGAHGGVAGGANMFPKLFVDYYEAARDGELERLRELHKRVLSVGAAAYRRVPGVSQYLRGVKGALAVLGICAPTMAHPFAALEKAELDEIRRLWAEGGLIE